MGSVLPRRLAVPALAALLLAAAPAGGDDREAVDLELVLAVDVSYSMDVEEQTLQRQGYAEALVSPEFLGALRLGLIGRIAVTYVEWAGADHQQVVVDWQVIDGSDSARAFSQKVAAAPLRRIYRTSISGALLYGADLIEQNTYEGIRKVIDISGDGVNNQGPQVDLTRDAVLKRGIIINGLPLLLKRSGSPFDIPDLDIYYEDCVIGGPGSFVIAVQEEAHFARAIRTKLVMELANTLPPQAPPGLVVRTAREAPRISCTIGERIWMERWGN